MSALPHVADWLVIDWVLIVLGAWLAVGIAGIAALRRFRFVARILFPIGGGLGLLLAGLALIAIARSPQTAVDRKSVV